MVVERFVSWAKTASAEERAQSVRGIARDYLKEKKGAGRPIREKIFTLCLDDNSPMVRAALANEIAACDFVPRSLIWNLIQDIPQVSVPIYQASPHLCTSTLIEAVQCDGEAVQCAIAKRTMINGDVARALVANGAAEAVLTLLENPVIVLGPVLKHDIAMRLGDAPAIRAHLLREDDLKPETRQMLVTQLSRSLFSMVDDNAWVDALRMQQVANDSANRVTINIAMQTDADAMETYVDHLRSTDQLTAALLVRGICAGNAVFFETALSSLSGMSMKRVQSIIDEGRMPAFKSLYKRTGLPLGAYPVFTAAITVWKQFGAAQLEDSVDEALLCERAINAILDSVENDSSVDGGLLTMLRRLSAEASRESARETTPQLQLTAA